MSIPVSTHAVRPVHSTEPLLAVRDLRVTFGRRGEEPFKAVDGVSFDVRPGQTVGLVGESGCGKSVTSLAIMGLLPSRGNTVEGAAVFDGEDLLGLSPAQMRDRRGREIAMIFQDPLSSLNPVVQIGRQVTEVMERHQGLSRKEAMPKAAELLERVGIPDPTARLVNYPHQLSGGMRQRALIAMALACRPRLLIADEPTTALDVTIQAQILALLKELVVETGTAMVMITHDLGVVAGLCDEVNVLYGGKIVERGDRHTLFARPRHPYTVGLLNSIPRLDAPRGRRSRRSRARWPTTCRGTRRAPSPPGVPTGSTSACRRHPAGTATTSSGCAASTRWGCRDDGRDPGRAAGRAGRGPRPRGALPDQAGDRLRPDGRARARRRRGGPVHPSRGDLRPGGRVRVRQVDPRQGDPQPRDPTAGSVSFDGVDIASLKGEGLRTRRKRFQMVFQDPMSSLDPRQTVEALLLEGMRAHGLDTDKSATHARLRELMSAVGLPRRGCGSTPTSSRAASASASASPAPSPSAPT